MDRKKLEDLLEAYADMYAAQKRLETEGDTKCERYTVNGKCMALVVTFLLEKMEGV